MKFSIITPTYRRSEKLVRAVTSILNQTYNDWELIIINDSPKDDSYHEFRSSLNDPRIHYHENETNRGVNYSRNKALDKLSADSSWVIFLDDDDYFAPDTLATFAKLIMTHSETKWFMTNRAKHNGEPVTTVPTSDTLYSYIWSYLILKKIRGDATHCIETKYITRIHARFSSLVKQGEEWFFFYQIGLQQKIFYHDHNSTITDGYDETGGLNFRKRSFRESYESLAQLFYEVLIKKILNPTIIIYLVIRFIKLFIK